MDKKAKDTKATEAPKEKEETNAERRAREEKEELKKERKEHKHEAHLKAHEAHAGGALMEDLSKKQAFKKFSFRGLDINKLLTMNMDELSQQLRSRQRRRLRRKLQPHYSTFIKKLMEAKKNCAVGEKPKAIKTHLRDCIVIPSMVQSVVNIHNGKGFNTVEIKPEMIGYYLGEFAMSYKRVMHGKPGVGATHSSKFVPIK